MYGFRALSGLCELLKHVLKMSKSVYIHITMMYMHRLINYAHNFSIVKIRFFKKTISFMINFYVLTLKIWVWDKKIIISK